MLSEKRRTLLGRITLGTLAAGAALTLSACGPLSLLTGGGTAVDVPDVPDLELETTDDLAQDPQDIDVFTLEMGDCFIEADMNTAFGSGNVSEVPVLDCSQPHDAEVFHVYDIEGSTFPGTDAVSADATETCEGQAFTDFIGVPYLDSEVYTGSLSPTEGSWNEMGDREVACYTITEEMVTGTLAGANR